MGIIGFVRAHLKLILEYIPIGIGIIVFTIGFGRGCIGGDEVEPAATTVVSITAPMAASTTSSGRSTVTTIEVPTTTVVPTTTAATTTTATAATTTTATAATTTTVVVTEAGMDWLLVDHHGGVAAVRPDGSDWRVLVEEEAGVSGAIFSPDGKSIAFSHDTDMQILDLDELTTRTVRYGALVGAWSPDGKQIAVTALGEEVDRKSVV